MPGDFDWRRLDAVDPKELTEARLQLHYAAQTVSGVGRTYLAKKDDDSHTNLLWSTESRSLTGRSLGTSPAVWAELAFEPFSLRVVADGSIAGEFALDGETTAAADEWMASEVASLSPEAGQEALAPLHYEMPAHELSDSGVFQETAAKARLALRDWFQAAAVVLQEVCDREPDASETACWPHHFDIATLIDLGDGKSVGVGLSPGDESYDEPYSYVGPYPRPRPEELKPLKSAGRWHTEGSVFAVLTGEEIVAAQDRAEVVSAFVDEAVTASKGLLEKP